MSEMPYKEPPFRSLPAMFYATCKNPNFKGCFLHTENESRHYSAQELLDTLKYLVSALGLFGITKGTRLGIIADTVPEWILSDLAVQILGGMTVPLFPNISEEHFLFQCKNAKVEHLLVANPMQLDSTLQKHLYQFKTVIRLDKKNESYTPQKNEVFFQDILNTGKEHAVSNYAFQKAIENVIPEDPFSLLYTSGSTGMPKGVLLTQRHILSQFVPISKRLYDITANVPVLSVLPIAHIFERTVLYFYFYIGAQIHFGNDPKKMPQLLKEVKPVVMTVVPRILERIYERILKISRTVKFPLTKMFLMQAIKYAQIHNPSKRISLQGIIFEHTVYKKIRQQMGGNFRYLISGSSALNKNVCRFFLNVKIPVCEGYGMTETSPVISLNINEILNPGSVGVPLECVTLKIDSTGEILVKGDNVFNGYYNFGEKNLDCFTEDGFFKTGDMGYFDKKGNLYLTGRIKEMLKTSTGKYVSPMPIEHELSHHALISAACIIANDKKFVSALIFLQPEIARMMLHIDGDDFSMKAATASVRINATIASYIERVNRHVNHWEQIRKWIILPDIPCVENGMLTPTLKLRRKEIESAYSAQIDALYKEA